jgi:hypothetical protein
MSSPDRHFWLNKCVEKCPKSDDVRLNPVPIAGAAAVRLIPGYVNSIEANGKFVCKKCNDNCLDCIDTVDRCSKCRPGMLLSKYDFTCVEQCPAGLGIPAPLINPTHCNKCDANCKTCEGTTNNCTSCDTNLLLSKAKGMDFHECKLNCNVDPLKGYANTMVTVSTPQGPKC